MATFTQLPGELDLVFTAGDEVPLALDFDRDLTNYTLSSAVYVVAQTVPTSGGSAQPTTGATVFTPTISVVSATAGTVMIGFSEAQTASLSPVGTYRWYFRWVNNGVTRTVVSGSVKAKAP